MTNDTIAERGIGDNAPPDDLAITLAAVVEDAGPWLTGAALADDDQAAAVAKLVERAADAAKAVKDAEEVEKRPHLDATAAIRKRYADSYAAALKQADAVIKSGKALLSKWQQAKQAARDAEAAKLAAEAAEKAEAARKALQSAGGDLDARIEAEAQAEEAKRHEIAAKAVGKLKVAPQIGGRSLRHRKIYETQVTDIDAAIAWAWENYFDVIWRDLQPLIEGQAEGQIRMADKAPGTYELPGIVVTVKLEPY